MVDIEPSVLGRVLTCCGAGKVADVDSKEMPIVVGLAFCVDGEVPSGETPRGEIAAGDTPSGETIGGETTAGDEV